jgi:serine/threonine protein kinase
MNDDSTGQFHSFPSELPDDPAETFESQRARPMDSDPFLAGGDSIATDVLGAASPARPNIMPTDSGTYEMRGLLGRGGWGEVWEAVQTSLGRTIAVKKLRADLMKEAENDPGAQWHLAVAFRQEAVIAASLEHPNIVPVHDLVFDDSGRPMLAMKLVKGRLWHRMIREDFASKDVDDFLALHIPILMDVAQAVAFAHSRGIIHRDIKPGQVMVGEFGEVSLMDWGLAIVDAEKESSIATTGAAAFEDLPIPNTASSPSGTASFMAPEQTLLSASGVGTWTDVYLLGGTLYTLLCGRAPHDAIDSKSTFHMAARGEVVPAREAAPGRDIPDELLALANRALEPEPANRVPSAKDFLSALNDYISGASRRRESIACVRRAFEMLEGTRGTYREFAEQLALLNRALTLWPGNISAVATGARVHAAYARAAIAKRDLTLAQIQAEAVTDDAERASIVAEIQKCESQITSRETQRRLSIAASLLLVLALAVGALIYTNDLARERDLVAETAHREALARAASDSSRRRAEELLNFMLNDLAEGLQPLNRLDLLGKVGSEALDYFDEVGPSDESPENALRRITAHGVVIRVLAASGKLEEAHAVGEKCVALADDLLKRDPTARTSIRAHIDARLALANVLSEMGDLAAARDIYAEELVAIESLSSEPTKLASKLSLSASTLHNLAKMKQDLSDSEAAEKDYLASIAMREQLNGMVKESSINENCAHLAISHSNLANLYRNQANLNAALEHHSAALALREQLVVAEADNADFRRDLSQSYTNIAVLYSTQGMREKAVDALGKAVTILERLLREEPGNVSIAVNLAAARLNISDNMLALGELDEGIAMLSKLVDEATTMGAREPERPHWPRFAAIAHSNIAAMELKRGNGEAALAHNRAAIEAHRTLLERYPDRAQIVGEHALHHNRYGETLRATGATEEALAAYERSLELRRRVEELGAGELDNQVIIVRELVVVGELRQELGDVPGAKSAWDESLARAAAIAADPLDGPSFLQLARAQALRHLGRIDEGRVIVESLHSFGPRPDLPEFDTLYRDYGMEPPVADSATSNPH